MKENPYRQAMANIRFDESFCEHALLFLNEAARRKNKARRRTKMLVTGTGAAACTALLLFALPAVQGYAPSPVSTSSSSLPEDRLVLQGGTVNYSDLTFPYTERTVYPTGIPSIHSMCLIRGFGPDLLYRCSLIVKGTVEKIDFGALTPDPSEDREWLTGIYQIRIDRIFYSSLDVEVGDSFVFEEILYNGSVADLMFGLEEGGQYFFPLSVHDWEEDRFEHSDYGLVFPYVLLPQVTSNGGYLFTKEWELKNEDTAEVVMDVTTAAGASYYDHKLYLRTDDRVEEDFQALVDKYCGPGAYRYQSSAF